MTLNVSYYKSLHNKISVRFEMLICAFTLKIRMQASLHNIRVLWHFTDSLIIRNRKIEYDYLWTWQPIYVPIDMLDSN